MAPDYMAIFTSNVHRNLFLFQVMTLQSGYQLGKLRVIYTSKLRDDLTASIRKLERTIESATSEERGSLPKPMPFRLQRRAWRVWYNKAPHAIGWSKRHYVFHDWRYGFDYQDVDDPKYVSYSHYPNISLGEQ